MIFLWEKSGMRKKRHDARLELLLGTAYWVSSDPDAVGQVTFT